MEYRSANCCVTSCFILLLGNVLCDIVALKLEERDLEFITRVLKLQITGAVAKKTVRRSSLPSSSSSAPTSSVSKRSIASGDQKSNGGTKKQLPAAMQALKKKYADQRLAKKVVSKALPPPQRATRSATTEKKQQKKEKRTEQQQSHHTRDHSYKSPAKLQLFMDSFPLVTVIFTEITDFWVTPPSPSHCGGHA